MIFVCLNNFYDTIVTLKDLKIDSGGYDNG